VEDAVDCHSVLRVFVKHRVWEPSNHSPSIIFIDHCVHFRVSINALNASVNASHEVFTEPGTPALVPSVGLKDIPFDFRREEQFNGHIDCELCVGFLASSKLSLDCLGDFVSGVPVLLFANRAPAQLRVWTRCHPRDLPLTGASLTDSTRKWIRLRNS
jgi:hypothetical protein